MLIVAGGHPLERLAGGCCWNDFWNGCARDGISLGPLFDCRYYQSHWMVARIVFFALISWEAVVFGAWCFGVSWFVKQHRDFIWLSPFLWVVIESIWPRNFSVGTCSYAH